MTLTPQLQSRNGDDHLCSYSITTGSGGEDANNFDAFDPVDGTTRILHDADCWDGLQTLEDEGYSEFFTVKYAPPHARAKRAPKRAAHYDRRQTAARAKRAGGAGERANN